MSRRGAWNRDVHVATGAQNFGEPFYRIVLQRAPAQLPYRFIDVISCTPKLDFAVLIECITRVGIPVERQPYSYRDSQRFCFRSRGTLEDAYARKG